MAAGRAQQALGLRLRTLYGLHELPSEAVEEEPNRRNLLGLSPKYADLSLDGQVRLELRTDRVREERCTPSHDVDPTPGVVAVSNHRVSITRW